MAAIEPDEIITGAQARSNKKAEQDSVFDDKMAESVVLARLSQRVRSNLYMLARQPSKAMIDMASRRIDHDTKAALKVIDKHRQK